MRPRIGERYDLIEEIGFGGMGSVWRGYDTVLDREIAVKLIRLTQIQSQTDAAEFAERFRREARITAQIRHHGVPQVYDAVLDADLTEVYLVMELVDGATTLRQYLGPGTPLSVEWATSIAAQIATALSYAHALPVVHRDLKPDNILVTPDGTVKIIDFGIAALLTPGVPKLTATGAVVGSVAYMSPEQAIGSKPTPRTDLYALGCILHEMLCGHPVFDGNSPMVLHDHAYTDPTPLREVRADIPAELEQLVLDLLAKVPEQRPDDAAAVYERLLPLLPPPNAQLPPTAGQLSGFPDPTRIFRQPNAPLQPDQVVPAVRFQDALPATAPISDAVLEDRIASRKEEYKVLVEDGRYVQAADVLASVLDAAGNAFGPDNRRVLDLRLDVALAHFVGGEYRKARTEFDGLADAFARVGGFADGTALQCRQYAMNCRVELGELTTALSGMRAVLADVRATQSDSSEMALELRLSLGRLLALTGDHDEAATSLGELYEDLILLRGSDDPLTVEVAEALDRLAASVPSHDEGES
ncbi:serine/threonine protein kinase [Nocardia terpenica]|uniref:serine/threonine-protein kinase n=1 Tax=Nocardia terpenica TaxID=455432 RepID=UPI001894AE35|nr:serine/threonine-protein kinase [Nocardia terpenica]MBF6060452.1 serine/threonine protein kinase [Nocardia terpenica]MBF6103712.1 serine/threonine protein kinase [Nocardia terpenica]MBF6111914.1 serine/threonine protein kinase [Nocardia terpenica]MBF6117933.1 serine/threonine protein kinase [Nocardia terpenica]MBF6155341.1 serine/threonine protein kinase [Nocardia terpenica]